MKKICFGSYAVTLGSAFGADNPLETALQDSFPAVTADTTDRAWSAAQQRLAALEQFWQGKELSGGADALTVQDVQDCAGQRQYGTGL